jgi:hypothetical protein
VAFRPEPPRIGFDPAFVVTAQPVRSANPEPERPRIAEPERAPIIAEAVVREEIAIEPAEPTPVEATPVEATPVEATPVEPVPVEPRRFAPDEAWSAGTPADRQRRLSPAMRHPHVPRPPAADPVEKAEPKRRWLGKRREPDAVRASVISAPEWARMSPGARRLYGLERSPEERRAG